MSHEEHHFAGLSGLATRLRCREKLFRDFAGSDGSYLNLADEDAAVCHLSLPLRILDIWHGKPTVSHSEGFCLSRRRAEDTAEQIGSRIRSGHKSRLSSSVSSRILTVVAFNRPPNYGSREVLQESIFFSPFPMQWGTMLRATRDLFRSDSRQVHLLGQITQTLLEDPMLVIWNNQSQPLPDGYRFVLDRLSDLLVSMRGCGGMILR